MRTTILLLSAGVLCLPAFARQQQTHPDLSGVWTLNHQVTDSLGKTHLPREGGRPMPPPKRPLPGAGTGVSAEYPMGDPNEGYLSTGQTSRDVLIVIDGLNEGNEQIRITPANNGIRIAYSDSTVLILPADGQGHKFPYRDFEQVNAKSQWKDGRLVVNYKIKGISLQETYERGVDSPRLIVTTQVPGTMRATIYRRVYDLRNAN